MAAVHRRGQGNREQVPRPRARGGEGALPHDNRGGRVAGRGAGKAGGEQMSATVWYTPALEIRRANLEKYARMVTQMQNVSVALRKEDGSPFPIGEAAFCA